MLNSLGNIHSRDIATVLHPQTHLRKHLTDGPTVMTHGEGICIYDETGNAIIDSGAALWCASLGYNSERLAKVAYETMRKFGYYHMFRGTSHSTAVELCERLIALAPVPMSKVLLQSSGSEANDGALKLVWYYWNAIGQPQRRKIISRHGSYHGSTCATISLTGKPEYHKGFGLPFPGFLYTDCPNHYRFAKPGESESEFSQRLADSLEALILAEGPETIAAMWIDPIQGSAGGLPPPAGYAEKIQTVLRKYDILLVADEVICGFARTGEMWGSQTIGLTPDIICSAKALSAAMQPVSAILLNDRIFEAMLQQSDTHGAFIHGHTYAGHPVASAVAVETLKIYEELDIVARVKALEPVFLSGLDDLKIHPLIGEANGCGLIGGIEIVNDKTKRTSFPASAKISSIIDKHARNHNIVVRFVADRLAFSPPLIITAAEITEMFDRVRKTLDDTYSELSA